MTYNFEHTPFEMANATFSLSLPLFLCVCVSVLFLMLSRQHSSCVLINTAIKDIFVRHILLNSNVLWRYFFYIATLNGIKSEQSIKWRPLAHFGQIYKCACANSCVCTKIGFWDIETSLLLQILNLYSCVQLLFTRFQLLFYLYFYILMNLRYENYNFYNGPPCYATIVCLFPQFTLKIFFPLNLY